MMTCSVAWLRRESRPQAAAIRFKLLEVRMRYMQSPSLSDEHDGDITSRGALRRHESPDERAETAAEDSIYDARLRLPRSATPQRSVFANNRPVSKRPSLSKRMLHASARFVLAVLIGVAATLSWQAYGDEAQKMVVTRIPSLGWLLPLSPTPSNTAAASSPDLTQRLDPMALDIVAIQRQVAQLAANQGQLAADEGQIARSIAAIQAAEQEVSEKISSIAEPKPVHVQARRPAQRIAPSSMPPEQQ
jgi:hypothetical protein